MAMAVEETQLLLYPRLIPLVRHRSIWQPRLIDVLSDPHNVLLFLSSTTWIRVRRLCRLRCAAQRNVSATRVRSCWRTDTPCSCGWDRGRRPTSSRTSSTCRPSPTCKRTWSVTHCSVFGVMASDTLEPDRNVVPKKTTIKTFSFILVFLFQSSLPELENPLSKKVRSIISDLLVKRPNSMKVKYFPNTFLIVENLVSNVST